MIYNLLEIENKIEMWKFLLVYLKYIRIFILLSYIKIRFVLGSGLGIISFRYGY